MQAPESRRYSLPWQVFGLRGMNLLVLPCVATSRLAPVSLCHARSPIPLRVSSGFSPDSRYHIWYQAKDFGTIYGINKSDKALFFNPPVSHEHTATRNNPMGTTPRYALWLLLTVAGLASPHLLAQEQALPAFSKMTSLADGWEPLEFPNIERHSRYELVSESGSQVVKAQTSGGASGLITRLNINPEGSLILSWRWKVSNVFDKGNAREKSGDDYPARIYVAFEFQPSKAGFFERAKRKTVEMLFGEELPGNALNYIWANTLPEGEFITNPYTDKTVMVAVSSGSERAGEWVSIERDIIADYREAFGENPPPIRGIAIMSDSDNTGEQATAWYGDITLTFAKNLAKPD